MCVPFIGLGFWLPNFGKKMPIFLGQILYAVMWCHTLHFYWIPVCKEKQKCVRVGLTWINAWEIKFGIPSACPSHRCVLMLPMQDWQFAGNEFKSTFLGNSGLGNTVNSWVIIVHLLKKMEQRPLVRISVRPPVTRTNVLSWFCSHPRMDVVVECQALLPFCRYLC